MNVLALFAGIGGVELGLEATGGFRTVCYVENDSYAVEVLEARMQEGALEDAPVWDDVATFDGRPWRGLVDVVTGGFPCQDISAAGKGAGIKEGTRSGLWSEMFRVIREVRPRYVLIENVSMLLARGLGRVLADLSSCGYDADWDCIPARSVGAPHRRDRIFIVAHTHTERLEECGLYDAPREELRDLARSDGQHEALAHADEQGPQGRECEVVCERPGELATWASGTPAMPDPQTWWLVDPADVADAVHRGPQGRRPRGDGESGDNRDEDVRPETTELRGESRRRATQPYLGRVAHGIPARVDRLRCLGNAVVPQVAYWVGLRIIADKEAP